MFAIAALAEAEEVVCAVVVAAEVLRKVVGGIAVVAALRVAVDASVMRGGCCCRSS
jgi:hypothetical protein